MQKSSRKLLVISLLIAVLAFVLYRSSRLMHSGDFFASIFQAIRRADPLLLGLSVVAIYGCYAIRALRWQVLQRNLGPSRLWPIYAMTLAGFASVFLLGRTGEPVRVLLLARKEKLPVADLFGVYFVERILDAASALFVAALALLLIETRHNANETTRTFVPAFQLAGALISIAVLVAIVFLAFLRVRGTAMLEKNLGTWLAAQNWRARVAKIILGLARGVQTVRTWGDLALATLYSAAHWFLNLMVYLWVAHAFGNRLRELNLADAMLLMAVTLVGSLIQLPALGGGSQAASILVFTKVFEVEPGVATAAAIVLWLVTFAACTLAGAPILIQQGLSLGQLKQMAAHEKEELEQR